MLKPKNLKGLKSTTRKKSQNKRKILEADLISIVKKKYGHFYLEWVRQNPVWKKSIPDYLVAQRRDRVREFTGKAGLIEFKCETNFLSKYMVLDEECRGVRPKIRKDGREQQMVFLKNLLSCSCIVNYNKNVQLVEEYKWVFSEEFPKDISDKNLPSRLVQISCCTLDDIKIKSIEDMLK